MKTILLAAGKSSRMNPFTEKNALSFCGEPLLIHLLKNATEGGFSDFILVCNTENKTLFESFITKEIQKKYGFSFQTTLQKKLSDGMAGGVLAGLELVEDDESVFVLGGNDMVDASIYQEILSQTKDCDGGILAKTVNQYFPGGYLEINDQHKILSIIEKPGEGNEPSSLVNIVAHFFQSAKDLKLALQESSSSKDDVYEVALQSLFETKHFKAIEYNGEWQAIKYPWHVLNMMDLFLKKQKSFIHPSATIADTARIRGEGVFISEGVKVFDNAVIVGPCYIGKNVIIGNNALVRESNIGEGCTIGYNSEVARSFLHSNVQAHIAYVGDSIVDSGVNFGAFSCTANLRLDQQPVKVKIKDEKISSQKQKLGVIVGKNAQIGTHAMMMPGSKIEKDSFVRPGVVWK
jgi:NDP-sugar pyrophosphorylase family protein